MKEYIVHIIGNGGSQTVQSSTYCGSMADVENLVEFIKSNKSACFKIIIDVICSTERIVGHGPKTVAVFSKESLMADIDVFLEHYASFFHFLEDSLLEN